MKTLLLGCGRSRTRNLMYRDLTEEFDELVTVDMDPDCEPDVVLELDGYRKLPFGNEEFDEICAYDFLEHIGKQGDWRGYFREFSEYHRVLKPGGTMGIIVPVGKDAFADPGHTRFFSLSHFAFLNQNFYKENTRVTDYRWYWKKNFNVSIAEENEHHIAVILEKNA